MSRSKLMIDGALPRTVQISQTALEFRLLPAYLMLVSCKTPT